MKCKHCDREIPDSEVRAYVGSINGKTKGPTKARDPEKMRQAVLKRWKNARSEE